MFAHPPPRPDTTSLEERGLRPPPGLGFWRRLWWWFDFVILVKLARLRFVAILLGIGAVIAYWGTLEAVYDKWTRPVFGDAEVAASDTEFWCPMHPTIVREKADKCPLCGMPLSRRKKGEQHEDEPLPPGVVSRVQLTPYRVALAGIQTAEVTYQPLAKEIQTVGFVEFDERQLSRISSKVTGKSRIDKLYVNVTGQTVKKGDPLADLYSPDLVVTVQNLLDARRGGRQDLERLARDRLRLWGIDETQIDEILRTGKPITHVTIRSPLSGHVIQKYQVEGEYVEEGARLYDIASLHTVWVEVQVYEDEVAFLQEGLAVTAAATAFPGRAFPGKVAFVHPHLDASSRTLRVRFDLDNPRHELRPGMYATVKLQVPVTQLNLLASARAEEWRTQTAAELAVHALFAPTGLAGLEPFLVAAGEEAVARQGQVLAVPERSVIDTGSRKLVYREAAPGVYEGVEVRLGPRSGGMFPVIRGLREGDRVATAGSFLIDAETRLTAGAGSIYFGASSGPASDRPSSTTARPSMADDVDLKIKRSLARLSAADRRLAEAQGFCPILEDNRLGSMGVPVKITVQDRPVFLCCKGCVNKALKSPDETLARLEQVKVKAKAPSPQK